MKLCFSSLAWPAEHDDEVADALSERGFRAIEIVPAQWSVAGQLDRERVAKWKGRGFQIAAAQALLFGRPPVYMLDPAQRPAFVHELKPVLHLVASAGARVAVLGAPDSRRIFDDCDPFTEARATLRALEPAATGVSLALEAIPGAPFLRTTKEVIDFVKRARLDGLAVNLDLAALVLSGEEPEAMVAAGGTHIAHVHISEPGLAPVAAAGEVQRRLAGALRAAGYSGSVSVEMREPKPFQITTLWRAMDAVAEAFR